MQHINTCKLKRFYLCGNTMLFLDPNFPFKPIYLKAKIWFPSLLDLCKVCVKHYKCCHMSTFVERRFCRRSLFIAECLRYGKAAQTAQCACRSSHCGLCLEFFSDKIQSALCVPGLFFTEQQMMTSIQKMTVLYSSWITETFWFARNWNL